MGGVTDGPTVIHHLKSVFPRTVKLRDGKIIPQTDNVLFRIITRLTPTIFLILAGLIFWQRMSGEHINCYTPPDHEDIRASAVNQYCFITGTYTVIVNSTNANNNDIMKKRFPYPGVGPHVSPSKNGFGVKYHLYFQWVPFILLIQAIILVIPRYIWKSVLKDAWSRYCECIVKTELNQENFKQFNRSAARRFIRNGKSHRKFFRGFLVCEFCNVLFAFSCIILSDVILNGEFISLGWKWLVYELNSTPPEYYNNYIKTSDNDPLNLVFPKMSKCEFRMFGPSGSIINYDLLCVMTLNVIHEKVFLFQWFWLWIVIILQTIRLIYTFTLRCSKSLRWRLLQNQLEASFVEEDNLDLPESEVDNSFTNFRRDAKKFLVKLGYSDWFMLERISQCVDAAQFTGFLKTILSENEKHGNCKCDHTEDKMDEEKKALMKLFKNYESKDKEEKVVGLDEPDYFKENRKILQPQRNFTNTLNEPRYSAGPHSTLSKQLSFVELNSPEDRMSGQGNFSVFASNEEEEEESRV